MASQDEAMALCKEYAALLGAKGVDGHILDLASTENAWTSDDGKTFHASLKTEAGQPIDCELRFKSAVSPSDSKDELNGKLESFVLNKYPLDGHIKSLEGWSFFAKAEVGASDLKVISHEDGKLKLTANSQKSAIVGCQGEKTTFQCEESIPVEINTDLPIKLA